MEADDLKKDSNLKKAEIDSSKKKILKKEIGGQDGPEPTRFGDWEKKRNYFRLLNYLFIRLLIRSSTTVGSANVDVSPRLL